MFSLALLIDKVIPATGGSRTTTESNIRFVSIIGPSIASWDLVYIPIGPCTPSYSAFVVCKTSIYAVSADNGALIVQYYNTLLV